MRKILFLFTLCMMPFAIAAAPAASKAVHARGASDAEIDRVIKTKLAKSKIGKDGFTETVKNGVVTWKGTTNVIQHKGAATRMARTAGATEVVNQIKIGDAARQKASANLRRVTVKPVE